MSPFVESLDSDSDGIRDTVDFCVYAKETYNSYQDLDGCPDEPNTKLFANNLMYDFDSDGILDKVDSCLTLPETYNGYQDEDGCPEFSIDYDFR